MESNRWSHTRRDAKPLPSSAQRIRATVAGQIQAEPEADHAAAFADPAHAQLPLPVTVPSHPVAVVAVDGGVCRIRNQEEFREFKVGVLGTLDPTRATTEQAAPVTDKHYVAHFAEADRAFEYISLEYHRMGLDRCNVLHVLGDGADWIWRRARSLCSGGQRYIPTLDYFHAAEPLGDLAKILFGPETPEAREWSKALRDLLDEDQVDDFLAGLDEKRRLALDRGDTEPAAAVRATSSGMRASSARRVSEKWGHLPDPAEGPAFLT